MKILLRLIVIALAVFVLPTIVPGISVSSFYTACIVALVLAIINITLKPLLFVLTLPVTILSLGLFAFVLNALMLLLVSTIVKGFSVRGFIPALIGSLIISVVSAGAGYLLKRNNP
jgi:putative membrane protein